MIPLSAGCGSLAARVSAGHAWLSWVYDPSPICAGFCFFVPKAWLWFFVVFLELLALLLEK